MAKRKTIQEKQINEVIRKELDSLGRKVSVIAARNSKISKLQKSHLRDSLNYRVKPFDTLVLTQFNYGQYNTPKGKATPKNRDNIKDTPLKNAIEENVPDTIKVITKNIIDLLMSPIVKK